MAAASMPYERAARSEGRGISGPESALTAHGHHEHNAARATLVPAPNSEQHERGIHAPSRTRPGRGQGPAGRHDSSFGPLISTIFLNIDILGGMRLPFLADPGTGRSWYDQADPEEWRVSSPDATMTAAGAAEPVGAIADHLGGGEAVGMPSLRQAARGLAAALSQGTTVAWEAGRLGAELTRIAWGRSDVAPARGDRRLPIRRGRPTGRSG